MSDMERPKEEAEPQARDLESGATEHPASTAEDQKAPESASGTAEHQASTREDQKAPESKSWFWDSQAPTTDAAKSGDGMSEDELDKFEKEYQGFRSRIDPLCEMIESMTKIGGLRKVSITLPKLSLNTFSNEPANDASKGYELVHLLGEEGPASDLKMTRRDSNIGKRVAEFHTTKLEAEREAERVRLAMEEEARKAMEYEDTMIHRIRQVALEPAVAALMSLLLALLIAQLPFGTVSVLQALAGFLAVVINMVGLKTAWHREGYKLYLVVKAVVHTAHSEIAFAAGYLDDMLMSPFLEYLDRLNEFIEKQSDFEAHVKKYRKTELEVVAQFDYDLPSPEDMRTPIVNPGLEDKLAKSLDKIKQNLPKIFDEIVHTTLAGRIATDGIVFNFCIIALPLCSAFIINIVVMTVQVAIHANTLEPNDKGQLSQEKLPACLQSSFFQLLLLVCQTACIFFVSQNERICKAINKNIEWLEGELSECVNERLHKLASRIDLAYEEVKSESIVFRHRCEVVTKKLDEAIQVAESKSSRRIWRACSTNPFSSMF